MLAEKSGLQSSITVIVTIHEKIAKQNGSIIRQVLDHRKSSRNSGLKLSNKSSRIVSILIQTNKTRFQRVQQKCEINNGVRNLKGSVSKQYSNRINGSVQDFRQGHDQRYKTSFLGIPTKVKHHSKNAKDSLIAKVLSYNHGKFEIQANQSWQQYGDVFRQSKISM